MHCVALRADAPGMRQHGTQGSCGLVFCFTRRQNYIHWSWTRSAFTKVEPCSFAPTHARRLGWTNGVHTCYIDVFSRWSLFQVWSYCFLSAEDVGSIHPASQSRRVWPHSHMQVHVHSSHFSLKKFPVGKISQHEQTENIAIHVLVLPAATMFAVGTKHLCKCLESTKRDPQILHGTTVIIKIYFEFDEPHTSDVWFSCGISRSCSTLFPFWLQRSTARYATNSSRLRQEHVTPRYKNHMGSTLS